MAEGIITLRPSADIYVEHIKNPVNSSTAFNLINEEVPDGGTTYIRGWDIDIDLYSNQPIVTSEFELSAVELYPQKRIVVTDVHVLGQAYVYSTNGEDEYNHIYLKINNTEVFVKLTTNDKNPFDYQLSEAIVLLNDYISQYNRLPDMSFKYETVSDLYLNNAKSKDCIPGLTQIYFTISYTEELNIFSKSNGTWKPATAAYRKQNGTWVNIMEEEAQTILSSKLVIDKCAFRGHIETPIADIEATCTETGMTGGMKCSYCGKIVKEHDIVIPTLEHSYYSTGACRECNATSPDRISFIIQRSTQESPYIYYSMPNLTWGEWVNNYPILFGDTVWQITSDGSVRYYYEGSTSTTDFTIDGVKSTDLIIAGHAYTATDATTA